MLSGGKRSASQRSRRGPMQRYHASTNRCCQAIRGRECPAGRGGMSELSDTEPRHCGIREPARHGCWRVEVVCDNGMDRRQQKRRGPAGDALPGPCTASHRMTPIDCRVAIITDPATTHCREGGIHYYTDEETFARPNDPWTRICKKPAALRPGKYFSFHTFRAAKPNN